MELFLNFLWVLIALGALVVWRASWARQARLANCDWLQEWTAFACALVFLFYAVSLSDDLHSDLVLFDEGSGGRRSLTVWTCARQSPGDAKVVPSSGAAILPRVPLFDPLRVVASITPFTRGLSSPLPNDLSSGRAPPASSL
jgi:hypothetical protein